MHSKQSQSKTTKQIFINLLINPLLMFSSPSKSFQVPVLKSQKLLDFRAQGREATDRIESLAAAAAAAKCIHFFPWENFGK